MSKIDIDRVDYLMLARDSQHNSVYDVLKGQLESMFNHSAFYGFTMVPDPIEIEQTGDIWALSFQSLSQYEGEDEQPVTIDNVFRIHALRDGDVYLGIADDYSNRVASGADIGIEAFDIGFKLTNIHNRESDPDKSVDLAVVEILEKIASKDIPFGEAYDNYIQSIPSSP